jgi:hypothetical protein
MPVPQSTQVCGDIVEWNLGKHLKGQELGGHSVMTHILDYTTKHLEHMITILSGKWLRKW